MVQTRHQLASIRTPSPQPIERREHDTSARVQVLQLGKEGLIAVQI
jgi:hypothetical protein